MDINDICNIIGDELGKGYAECVYQEGICVLLRENMIVYSKEVVLPIKYNDTIIGNVRADIVLHDEKTIIECKAIDSNLKPSHFPQIITYMNLLGYKNGILVNFNQNPSKEMVEIAKVKRLEHNKYVISLDETEYYLTKSGKIITQ
jgi:GxxExxY protein